MRKVPLVLVDPLQQALSRTLNAVSLPFRRFRDCFSVIVLTKSLFVRRKYSKLEQFNDKSK